MALPCFYVASDLSGSGPGNREIVLDEDTSKHVVQVLRMKPGEQLQLTDGKGNLLTARIVDDHKKKCLVRIGSIVHHPAREKKVTLAISLLKNANRLEWLLEKVTEIGVTEIIPLICERTEKQHFRQDRMQHILVSAMLQSQQVWLPVLSMPAPFAEVVGRAGRLSESAGQLNANSGNTAGGAGDVAGKAGYGQKYIAHCLETERTSLADVAGRSDAAESSIILIGPEGDFSPKEVELALRHGFLPVTLGETRLRTETAGMVAATLLCITG
jgi:16S rRNA (uracil1498-N3)-methyltransferase